MVLVKQVVAVVKQVVAVILGRFRMAALPTRRTLEPEEVPRAVGIAAALVNRIKRDEQIGWDRFEPLVMQMLKRLRMDMPSASLRTTFELAATHLSKQWGLTTSLDECFVWALATSARQEKERGGRLSCLERAFRAYDHSGKGVLHPIELMHLCEDTGFGATADHILRGLSFNSSGGISYAELMVRFRGMAPACAASRSFLVTLAFDGVDASASTAASLDMDRWPENLAVEVGRSEQGEETDDTVEVLREHLTQALASQGAGAAALYARLAGDGCSASSADGGADAEWTITRRQFVHGMLRYQWSIIHLASSLMSVPCIEHCAAMRCLCHFTHAHAQPECVVPCGAPVTPHLQACTPPLRTPPLRTPTLAARPLPPLYGICPQARCRASAARPSPGHGL